MDAQSGCPLSVVAGPSARPVTRNSPRRAMVLHTSTATFTLRTTGWRGIESAPMGSPAFGTPSGGVRMSTLTATVDLRPVPASVPVARHLVLDLLGAWRAPHDAGDAALLVTELVANVVDHVAGGPSFTLEVALSE